MATARPPSGGQPTARIGIDLSLLQRAPQVARQAAQQTAREINQAFQSLRAEQRLALEQARQTTAVLRAQQTQITATARADSSVRMSVARAEAQAQQQAARTSANTRIEEERRVTAQFRSELRTREAAQRAQLRASQMGGFGGFGRGVAGAALGALGGPVGAVAGAAAGGALPAAAGLALVEGGRFALSAAQMATAYDRQRLAALALAGSQGKLNELMAAYQRATGGAVDEATALADVTNLQAIGFARNSEELERFVRAARGISIAKGTPLDEIVNELALGIANQSTRRFDQLGLSIQEVNERIEELRSRNSDMTREMAFQEAVLSVATEKYGQLTDEAAAQANGLEMTARAWRDLRLEIGQITQGPLDAFGQGLAFFLDLQTARLRAWVNELDVYIRLLRQMGMAGPWLTSSEHTFVGASAGRDMARHARTGATPRPGFKDEQLDVMVGRGESLRNLSRETDRALTDTILQGARQRNELVSNYEKQRSREAEDFQRQRLNAERQHNLAILDVMQDSARQRGRWQEELERNLEEQRQERDERITEAREDSAERVADIEERFNRDREKRQRDFAERIRDAAANLDAVAVRELQREQREQREENEEAERSRDEAIAGERESLQERINDANEAYAEQEADQREALQRRIELQAEEDRLRIEEMKAAWEEQKTQEDIERGIRLERQAQDHNDQLGELDRQQGERIQQIKDHAQEERDEIDRQYELSLAAVGIKTARYISEHERIINEAINGHIRYVNAINDTWKRVIPGHPSQADPYANDPDYINRLPSGAILPPMMPPASGINNSRTSSVVIQPGAIQIIAAPGMNEQQVGDYVLERMADFMEDYADR